MNESKELEELQNQKTRLDEESRSLKGRQENLEERVKVLEETIAIEQLKNNNKATREAITQLESKIDELERNLEKVSREPETNKPQVEPEVAETPKPDETPFETAETTTEDSEEEFVTTTATEEPMMTEPEIDEGKRTHDKKKRKFF